MHFLPFCADGNDRTVAKSAIVYLAARAQLRCKWCRGAADSNLISSSSTGWKYPLLSIGNADGVSHDSARMTWRREGPLWEGGRIGSDFSRMCLRSARPFLWCHRPILILNCGFGLLVLLDTDISTCDGNEVLPSDAPCPGFDTLVYLWKIISK